MKKTIRAAFGHDLFKVIAPLALFFILFALAHRGWLFEPNILFGHNWDFSFPEVDELGPRVVGLSTQAHHNYHGHASLISSHVHVNALYSLLASVFSVSVASRLILFFCSLIAFVGMQRFLNQWTTRSGALFGATLYAFSPFFFSIIIAGSWYAWVSYAFIPIFIDSTLRYMARGRVIDLVVGALAATLSLTFLQYIPIAILAVLWLVVLDLFCHRLSFLKTLLRGVIFTAISTLLNLYWLYPFLADLTRFQEIVAGSNTQIVGNFAAVENSTQSLFFVFLGAGFLDRNFYFNAIPDSLVPLFVLGMMVMWLVIFMALFRRKSAARSQFLGVLVLFLLVALMVKGGNPPFGDVTMWVYRKITLFRMYRSPQNLFFIIAFLMPILLAMALKVHQESGWVRAGQWVLPLIPFILIGWLAEERMGRSLLEEKKVGHIDFYKAQDDLKNIIRNNLGRKLAHTELFIPTDYSIRFLLPPSGTARGGTGPDQQGGQGGEPNYPYLKNISALPVLNDQNLVDRLGENLSPSLLAMHSIRYITLRRDVAYHFRQTAPDYMDVLETRLEKGLVKTYDGLRIKTYQVRDEDFRPVVMACEKNLKATALDWAYEGWMGVDAMICARSFNPSLPKVDMLQTPDLIEYRKVEPYHYRLRLRGVQPDKPVLLRLGVPHDTHWRIIPADSVGPDETATNMDAGDSVRDTLNARDALSGQSVQELSARGLSPTRAGEGGFISKLFHGVIQNDNLPNDQLFGPMFPVGSAATRQIVLAGVLNQFNGWIIDPTAWNKSHPNARTLREDGRIDLDLAIVHGQQYRLYQGWFVSGLTLALLIFLGVCAQWGVSRPPTEGQSCQK